jgi:hypothetical protein
MSDIDCHPFSNGQWLDVGTHRAEVKHRLSRVHQEVVCHPTRFAFEIAMEANIYIEVNYDLDTSMHG